MQYFDPVVNYSEKEVFVDCGAYTGDTAEVFMERVNNKYEYYYAFEPDSENREKAGNFLSNKPNTKLIPKGVWDSERILSFRGECAQLSEIAENGEFTVEVTSIDTFFAEEEHIPTTIKMDIEGSELEALKGAKSIICSHKPKLAICIYHKPEDLYEIPEFIKSCRTDYKFYIRHYMDTFSELVLYAV